MQKLGPNFAVLHLVNVVGLLYKIGLVKPDVREVADLFVVAAVHTRQILKATMQNLFGLLSPKTA